MSVNRSALTLRAYVVDPGTGRRRRLSTKTVRRGQGVPDRLGIGAWPPCSCPLHRRENGSTA